MDRFIFQSNEPDYKKQPSIEEILSYLIGLSDRIRLAVGESKSYKLECAGVGEQVDRLSQMLRSAVRFTKTTPFYEQPVRYIFTDVAKTLDRALSLVRKCRRRSVFRRFFVIVGDADFRKVINLLDVSIGDTKWLLGLFDGGEGIIFSLPPIASCEPMLAWVWSYIASLHLCSLNLKIEVAHELASVGRDNYFIKDMLVAEGAISPLLKLLKEDSSPEAQIASAMALFNLADNQNRARSIFNEHGVLIIVQVFRNSSIIVQSEVAKLIARMAEHDSLSQEGFGRENVIGSLVTLLSIDISTNSIVDNNNQMETIQILSSNYTNKGALSSSKWSKNKKESKIDPSQLLLEFKTNCSGALWMLARGNFTNCKKLTETKGLLYLAKVIEHENGELQINCLMTITEITTAAEYNHDFRRSTFKTNSPAAKAIVDQLLRLIQQSDNSIVKIPAIKAIGNLSRTFPATQTQVIGPLVKQLSHWNPNVATESLIALGKFTCSDNFLCAEHSKSVIEFEGIQPLLRLLRGSERTQYHAMVLLCYTAMHCGNCEPLVEKRLFTVLQGANTSIAYQYTELRELVTKAIDHLSLSHGGLVLPR